MTLADDRVILLDLEADRYFGLRAGLEEPVRAEIKTISAMAAGGRPGLVVGSRTFAAIEDGPPTASLLERALPPATPWSVTSAGVARAQAAFQLRHQPLCKILADMRTRKSALRSPVSTGQDIERKVLPLVSAFRISERIISGHDRCLSLSLALARMLVRRDVAVDLIIGVRASPFAAHAWVQLGPVLLADELDRVRRFSPVMTV